MERLTSHVDEVEPAKAKETGRLQRWVRAALLGTLTVVCGGGDARFPDHPHHGNITEDSALQNAVPPRTDGLPGTFSEERVKDPRLTEEQYLDLLALSLDTPKKLGQYLRTRIQYVKELQGENYWQTPEETIQRGEGDCEDYAFLAQRILEHQGKNAHVVSNVQDHASCVWIQKRPDGRYDGYNFDDFGMDKNGDVGEWMSRPYRDTSPRTSVEGHESVLAALNAALSSNNGKGYSVHPYLIPVLRLRDCGIKHHDYTTIYAFDPDAPSFARTSNIDAAALFALLGGGYAAFRRWKQRRERKSLEKCSRPSVSTESPPAAVGALFPACVSSPSCRTSSSPAQRRGELLRTSLQ